MAAALRINASSEPRSSPPDRKRKSTGSHDGNNDKRNPSVMSDKYIHVHHYLDTGRWGTWFNDPTLKRGSGKRRLYFGTYETEYLAARAQDRAALKFKPYAVRPITRLNFAESDYELDKDLRDNLTHEQFRRLLMAESRKCYRRAEPSPCWKIFLEEEAAKGNILIEYGNRSNRFHGKSRTFAEVLKEILGRNQNEAVNIEETTEPRDEPVTTGEEEGKVYTAKRTKRPTQSAPNQPVEEVTKELVAEDSAALPRRSLSARKVRKTTCAAAPPIRHDSRSASLSARPVRKATPKAAPPVRRDAQRAHLSARQVRKATPNAAPPVRHHTGSVSLGTRSVFKATPNAAPPLRRDTGSVSLGTRPVFKATPNAAPPVRRDTGSVSLGTRPVFKAIPKAAPPVRRDAKSSSLSAPQVRKAITKAAPAVLRCDTRNPSQSARPVSKGAPEAAPPVRRERSIFKRMRRTESRGRSALQTQQISDYLDRLEWGRTRGRSKRNFNKLSLPNAASTVEVTVAADSMNIAVMAANVLSVVPNGTSGTSDGKVDVGGDHTTVEILTKHGKVDLGSDHTTVENSTKHVRLNIDLNREPEPSSTASPVAPPHDSDATGGNDDDPEVSSVETLLLLKSGWLSDL